jgi:threonyl-tRNA synthetase
LFLSSAHYFVFGTVPSLAEISSHHKIPIKMAKEKKEKKGGAAAPAVHATAKFAVLDYPGETQPDLSPPPVEAPKATSPAITGGAQGRRAKAGSGPKMAATGLRLGGDSFVGRSPNPAWLQQRVTVYNTVKERRAAELAQKQPVPIAVTMPDGAVFDKDAAGTPFTAWVTTPYDVAAVISQGLADAATVARVTYASLVPDYSLQEDGMEGEDTLSDAMADGGIERDDAAAALLWDMTRPLVGSVARLELLKFETDAAAKTVFWHSSAHMMGEALEHLFGSKLTIGPPLAGGFYYDSYMGTDTLKEEDCTCFFLAVSMTIEFVFRAPILTLFDVLIL